MILNTKQINYRIFYALLFLGAASGLGRFQLVEIEDDYGEADGAIDPTPDAGAANGKRLIALKPLNIMLCNVSI